MENSNDTLNSESSALESSNALKDDIKRGELNKLNTTDNKQPKLSQKEEIIEYPVKINIKTLMAAGAHYGHQTDKWNPKMLPFIYCQRNHIHIINLDVTLVQWKKTRKFICNTVSKGGFGLLVGTKMQARDMVKQEAVRCKSFYVNTRWLGGTLSNFQTVKNSIERMRKYEELLEAASKEDSKVQLVKKEKLYLIREIAKLERSLGGIREMKRLPDFVFVVDVIKERIAVAEARGLRIPVIGLIDTNCDPECVDYPIVCNDDAARTLRLLLAGVSDAILEGQTIAEHTPRKRQKEEKKEEKKDSAQRKVEVQYAQPS